MPTFEQGPIRPPSEAGSLLLRFTRNCPWNRCSFCPVYKRQKFSRRSLQEIRQDIDAVAEMIEDLQSASRKMGFGGELTQQVLNAVLTQVSFSPLHRQVAFWHYTGSGTVFIQDANSLIMDTRTLVEALRYVRSKIPGIKRVTSYARSSTLARKSLDELKEIREAGLDRIHIGLESGSDRVLEFMHKGVTAAQHIEAGRKVIDASMELSEYIMPGLGGREWSTEHATETARVLNAIDPHYIRVRSLRIPPRTVLFMDVSEGRFQPLSDDETVLEIRLFMESLEGIRSTVVSDHIMNLLPEVEGTLPGDKVRMLAIIEKYLTLPENERLLYRFGRRGGAVHSLVDLQNPVLRDRLEQACRELQSDLGGDMERIIKELGDQYI